MDKRSFKALKEEAETVSYNFSVSVDVSGSNLNDEMLIHRIHTMLNSSIHRKLDGAVLGRTPDSGTVRKIGINFEFEG